MHTDSDTDSTPTPTESIFDLLQPGLLSLFEHEMNSDTVDFPLSHRYGSLTPSLCMLTDFHTESEFCRHFENIENICSNRHLGVNASLFSCIYANGTL